MGSHWSTYWEFYSLWSEIL